MTCEDACRLIHGCADGEIDLRIGLDLEQHLRCASCAREHESVVALRFGSKRALALLRDLGRAQKTWSLRDSRRNSGQDRLAKAVGFCVFRVALAFGGHCGTSCGYSFFAA
jgi:hypothetical protein